MQCSSTLIFLFPFLYYASLINLQKGRENICGIFGLLSSFSPRLPWQGIVGGGHERVEGVPALLPQPCRALGHSVEELWCTSFNDQKLCVELVLSWEVLVPGGETAHPQRVPEVHASVQAGAAVVFVLCFKQAGTF